MNDEILKYYNYTLQELGVVSFYTEDIEDLFQDAYIEYICADKKISRKQAEIEYCYYISKKIVRRYYE